jgi:predicted nucleic acid-binding protein
MRVLVDTSVWIDHLRRSDPKLVALLEGTQVVMHPAVLGELACGMISNRQELLSLWLALPCAVEVSSAEGLALIEDRRLWGRGLGWTDVHLLGSALVSQARLWTRDHPLRQAASQLRISLVT